MDRAALAARYRTYIDDINAGRFDAAADFYHEQFPYGDEPFSRSQMRDLFAGVQAMVPDTHIEICQLIIEGDQLCARLRRTGTAVQPYMGIPPSGKQAVVAEHAIYTLRDGRVAAVWSVVDLAPLLAGA